MRRPPTDFELLRAIYEAHEGEWEEAERGSIAIPIDIPAIAEGLGVSDNSVFGRLYYHLDPIYEIRYEDGPRKALFIAQQGDAKDKVNFPVLEAAYAGLWQERSRDRRTFWVSSISIGIAAGSLIVAIAAVFIAVS